MLNVLQNIVAIVIIFVKWCIPDMSPQLKDQIKREAYFTNKIIIKEETNRANMGKFFILQFLYFHY